MEPFTKNKTFLLFQDYVLGSSLSELISANLLCIFDSKTEFSSPEAGFGSGGSVPEQRHQGAPQRHEEGFLDAGQAQVFRAGCVQTLKGQQAQREQLVCKSEKQLMFNSQKNSFQSHRGIKCIQAHL